MRAESTTAAGAAYTNDRDLDPWGANVNSPPLDYPDSVATYYTKGVVYNRVGTRSYPASGDKHRFSIRFASLGNVTLYDDEFATFDWDAAVSQLTFTTKTAKYYNSDRVASTAVM